MKPITITELRSEWMDYEVLVPDDVDPSTLTQSELADLIDGLDPVRNEITDSSLEIN